jgi:hypothetical protein
MRTPRIIRLALAGSTGLALLITHAYLDFVSFENYLSQSEHLTALAMNLGRLETALTLITLALLAWVFTRQENN